jgi:hypothetical protein
MMMPKPFQIPMSTLISDHSSNLLAAGKAISVTHITNGAFRLHPVEWNVGEAAGAIASMAIRDGHLPDTFEVQRELAFDGVPLVWFDDLGPDDGHFAAIQLAAAARLYPMSDSDLHASPNALVTRREAANALASLFGTNAPTSKLPLDVARTDPSAAMIAAALAQGWMAVDHRNWFHPDLPFYWTDWRKDRFPHPIEGPEITRSGPVRRGEFAELLASTLSATRRCRSLGAALKTCSSDANAN